MSDVASSPAETTAERAARHLAALRELTEIGMRIARALEAQVVAPDASRGPGQNPAIAFGQVARAIRQTIALEGRLERETATMAMFNARMDALRMPVPGFDPDAGLRAARKRYVTETVEARIGPDHGDRESLLSDLHERLEDMVDKPDFIDRPVPELIAEICQVLGVKPDAELWGLAGPAPRDPAATPPPLRGEESEALPDLYLRLRGASGEAGTGARASP